MATGYTDVETFLPGGRTDDAKLYLVRLVYNHSLSPKTTAFAGVRWQRRDATLSLDYREMAVFVGVTYFF